MESLVLFFRENAARCRRLADTLTVREDPAVAALLELAAEFEMKADEAEAREIPGSR